LPLSLLRNLLRSPDSTPRHAQRPVRRTNPAPARFETGRSPAPACVPEPLGPVCEHPSRTEPLRHADSVARFRRATLESSDADPGSPESVVPGSVTPVGPRPRMHFLDSNIQENLLQPDSCLPCAANQLRDF